MKTIIVSLFLSLLLLFACKKDSFTNSPTASVIITTDTLKYDTVFTSRGSTTQSFKIINDNKEKLRLTSVKLMGGTTSAFKMNVDGLAAIESKDIEINGNDSVYVFVQVNVDPSAGNLPFVIRDSIQITYNGVDTLVQLEAWGQNAHFLREEEVLASEVWTNDLPYVILGYLHVNSAASLTLDKGCRIFVHADAPIVIDGTLKANGEADTANHIFFQGDRLDEPYKDYPASWPGIYFGPSSHDNILTYAYIRNAYQSIVADGPAPTANPKISLNQIVIDNSYDAGILAVNSSISAKNCLISNCGKNIQLQAGNYEFLNCTVSSYSNNFISHKEPVLAISNAPAGTGIDLIANFKNCILWGDNGLVDDEVIVSKTGTSVFNVGFDHVLWKVKNTPTNINAISIISNEQPLFDSINTSRHYYDFRLKTGSPAVDNGVELGLTVDLDGKTRPVGIAPDLGSFEKQ